jgi:hypothetical protein
VSPGSGYTLTEGATAGSDLVGVTCDDNSPVTNINLSPGETVTCTFTNRRKGLQTGAKTIGFWNNKNGQAIVKAGAATKGVCNSGTWLRQYAPFQDLDAKASCTQVATYVSAIVKAANASGTSMNAMLKAQMLATALSVYFSDASLGGNKLSAPGPIGAVKIDLTDVCRMVDAPDGSATCGGVYEDVSSVFGGALSLKVSEMLTYAAGRSNPGGSTWYDNVKSKQEQAKNAFDAINNGVALGPP